MLSLSHIACLVVARAFIAAMCFAAVTLGMAVARGTDQPSAVAEPVGPVDATQAPDAVPPPTKPVDDLPLPLVVRVDKTALTPYTDSDRDARLPVDKWVLGARAVGTSHTVGEVRGELIPDSTEATFDIVFRGSTVSKTAARNDPALVYSRTFTDFVLTQRIAFEPHKGFVVVGEPRVEGTTRLVYDGYGSTRRLGRRLITRIAARKSRQMHEQARLIADRDNKLEVKQQFVDEVAKQVQAANDGLGLVKYVNEFLGENTNLQLHAKSTRDYIYLGLGPEGEKYAPMAELPTPREKPAPVEIWVHASIAGKPVGALISLLTPDVPVPLLVQSKILGALSAPITAGEATINVDVRDGWLVLGLPQALPPPEDKPAAAEAAEAPQAKSAALGGGVRR